MNIRKQKLFGKAFLVPSHVVRLDDRYTHGWQLRYGESKFFADGSNDGTGAAESLRLASEELGKRIARLPAATGLRTDVMSRKKSDLPLGISGPIPRLRPGRMTPYYSFQVSVPIVAGRSSNRSVYIGTENTMTPERIEEALARAIALRDSSVRERKSAATKAKRAAAVVAGILPAQ